MQEHLSTMEQFVQTQQEVMAAYLAARQGTPPAAAPSSRFPFFHDIVEIVPGVRGVARHRFSAEREIIFHDHALGRDISTEDPSLLGLTLVPLTVTMEMLAEGGALLQPDKLLVGMRDIRASRWITLEKPDYTIEATATQTAPGEIHVALREVGSPGTLRPILAEAVALYAERYPDSGPARPFVLENEKRSAWIPEQLYRTGMFHGSLMQGAKSVERTGLNGASATLEVLPHTGLFADDPRPVFLFDPVLLDAAGQAVAYWFWEAIEKGTDLFPYRVGGFHCYAAAPPTGTRLECRVLRRFASDKVIHSDIEVLDRAGKVYYRLENWETRRFPQPPRFLRLRIDPRGTYISTPWKEPIAALNGRRLACCRVEGLSQEFLESSHGVWLKTLAYLVLSRRERALWENLQLPLIGRYDWLLGRSAAKDAVRMLIQERCGEQLCAADVEILADASGRPVVEGAWKQRLHVNPVVAMANSGIAGAVAALDAADLAGVDLGVRAGAA
jgi:phosphopantetheinyl transferase (holo-ACP synthase)